MATGNTKADVPIFKAGLAHTPYRRTHHMRRGHARWRGAGEYRDEPIPADHRDPR